MRLRYSSRSDRGEDSRRRRHNGCNSHGGRPTGAGTWCSACSRERRGIAAFESLARAIPFFGLPDVAALYAADVCVDAAAALAGGGFARAEVETLGEAFAGAGGEGGGEEEEDEEQ